MSRDLTRLTINLAPRVEHALDEVATANDEGKTAAVNRAILLYRYVTRMVGDGWTITMRRDGEERSVELL